MVEQKLTEKEWDAIGLKKGIQNRIDNLDRQIKKLQAHKKNLQKQL